MSIYKNIAIAVLFFFLGQMSHGQAIQNSPPIEKPIYIEGFTYPKFDDLSHYAWSRLNFRMVEGTELGLGVEHYRRYDADRFMVALRVKQQVFEKSYLLGGYQKEWDLYNKGQGRPNPMPRQELFFGVEYEARPNMLLEAQMVRPTGVDPGFYSIGLEGVGSHIRLGTKMRF
ncbi:hypothetical protein [Flagellimonas taeanensis]|nr:hypothetical protein [Allomuricauda taeanensis]